MCRVIGTARRYECWLLQLLCTYPSVYSYTLTNLQQFCMLGMIDGLDDCCIQLCTLR